MELMRERGIVDTMTFGLIAWDAVGDATNAISFSPGFSAFVTKYVSHFGGTKKMLGNWEDNVASPMKTCPTVHGVRRKDAYK